MGSIIERDMEKRFPDKDSEYVLYCVVDFALLGRRRPSSDGLYTRYSMDGGWRGCCGGDVTG